MNVASAVALLTHKVGAAIRYLVSLQKLPKEALTTAWFFEQLFRWFTLMTSRAIKTALSDFCPQKAHEVKVFLENFKEMFSLLVISDNLSKVALKPVQTGVLISTKAALHLRNHFLMRKASSMSS
uniref:Putative secreted protein n=1 Tax=Ixodes ricinus TaxID=34613 RepID=A0A6B0UQ69_IXORI